MPTASANKKFWTFRAADGDGAGEGPPAAGELLLYGPLSEVSWLGDEVTPRQFHDDLTALGDISTLNVFINSPGGDVFAGQAIHSMLARHKARVTVTIDGLAASSASLVAMAGDTIRMPKNAMMMVHNPWTFGIGDAREFRKLADTLDSLRESMLAVYQAKTGKDRSALIHILNAETWLTAEEAIAEGFADELEKSKKVAASLVRPGVLAVNGLEMDVSRYSNVPDFAAVLLRDGSSDGERMPATKREIERALRDVGYSQAEAKTILAGKWQVSAASPLDPAERMVAIAGQGVTVSMNHEHRIPDGRRDVPQPDNGERERRRAEMEALRAAALERR